MRSDWVTTLQRLRREPSGGACIEIGCDEDRFALGLCAAHAAPSLPRTFVAADYQGVHREIKRYVGPARRYRCTDCDRQAAEWSYQGGAADERPGSDGPFSRDPSFYVPRCRSCHKSHDVKPLQRCRRGHPFDADNTDVTSQGRRCGACMRRAHVVRYRSEVGYHWDEASA